MDEAGDRRCRGLAGNDSRHAIAARRAVRAWPYRPDAAWPASDHSRRLRDQRQLSSRRVCQHGGRSRALFRAAFARRAKERAIRRQPARNGPPPMAKPAFQPRAILRLRDGQRLPRWVGLVRSFGRPARLYFPYRRAPHPRAHHFRPDQSDRWLGRGVGRWDDPCLEGLGAARRAQPQKVREWSGRWWTLWGAVDLLPMGNKVIAVGPGFLNPMLDAAEIEITGRNAGRIAQTTGYGSQGEPVRCVRAKSGKIIEMWLGATKFLPAARVAREMEARYGTSASGRKRAPRRRRRR